MMILFSSEENKFEKTAGSRFSVSNESEKVQYFIRLKVKNDPFCITASHLRIYLMYFF